MITIEVAYAQPYKQYVIELQVAKGTTAEQAIQLSGIQQRFPDEDLQALEVGVFAEMIDDPKSYVLEPFDRVELYRPLTIDPKEARRQRAERAQQRK